jgi:hypothetical protein
MTGAIIVLLAVFFVVGNSFSSGWFGQAETWLEESQRVATYELKNGCVAVDRYGQEVLCDESKKRLAAIDAKHGVTPRFVSDADRVTFRVEEYETMARSATESLDFVLAAANQPDTFDSRVQGIIQQLRTSDFQVVDIAGGFTYLKSDQPFAGALAVVREPVVLFEEMSGEGYAEVGRDTGEVVVVQRTVQSSGDTMTELQIEMKVRQFLHHVYLDFPVVEDALMLKRSVKEVQPNAGAHTFYWSDVRVGLSENAPAESSAFLQVDVTDTGYIFGYQNTLSRLQNNRGFFENNLPTALPGWYTHQYTDTGLLLTRSAELPDVGATEGYSYGEHISISVGNFAGDENNLSEWDYLSWVYNDEALVQGITELQLAGLTTLRVEHEAAGSSGGQLTYFIFSENKIFTLSLYSPANSEQESEFEAYVQQFAAAIQSSHSF